MNYNNIYRPIGNINQPNPNMGPLGQMGGYYSGVYNTAYNPYLMKMQMQRQQAMEQEKQRQQIELWKKMSRAVNSYTGRYTEQEMKERLKMYDPQAYTENEEMMEYNHINNLMRINEQNQQGQSSYHHINLQRQIDFINSGVAESINKYEDMSVAEFMNTAMGDLLYEAKQQEYRRRQRQVGNMYNSQTYNQLINNNITAPGYFNSMYDNNKPFHTKIDISDMEVTLPKAIQDEMDARKARFLNSIA